MFNNNSNQKIIKKESNYQTLILIGVYLSFLAFVLVLLLIFTDMPLEVQQVIVLIMVFLILMSFSAFQQIITPESKETFFDKFQPSFDNRVITYKNSYYYENFYHSQKQNLVEAAAEIQQLLDQLSQNNFTVTSQDRMVEDDWIETIEMVEGTTHQELTEEEKVVVAKVMTEINNNSHIKLRILKVLKAGEIAAFQELIRHPLTGFIIAAIEAWQEDETNSLESMKDKDNKQEQQFGDLAE